MATDTFALTWDIVKRGRGDKKHLKWGRRFEMQSNMTYHSKYWPFAHEHTIQFNSDVSTATQTRKDPFIICTGKRGRRVEDQHRHLPHCYLFMGRSQIPSVYCQPHNLGASSENTFRSVVNLRFRCLTSIFFLLELRKSIIYFGGSMIQDNGHNVAGEYLLLLVKIHILQSTYVKDWLIVKSFPSIWRIESVTIGTKISRENMFTSNLCLMTREC